MDVYPGLKFAVSITAQPKIEEVDYANAGGLAAKARAFSLEQDGKIYKVAVADFSRTGFDEIGILDLAVKTVTRNVAIKLDQRCGYNDIYTCRETTFVGADGSHSAVASVHYQGKLYQIQGTVLPLNADPLSGDAVRFQLTFRFTNYVDSVQAP